MFACPSCHATSGFMAFKDGTLIRILEDSDDTEGLDLVKELLCTECNTWFPNPYIDPADRARELECELVTVTGMRGKGVVKVIATGVKFEFKFSSHQQDAIDALGKQPKEFQSNLMVFSEVKGHELGLRVKEPGNPNTWLYRLDARKVRKALQL